MVHLVGSWHRILLEMLLIYHLKVFEVRCLRGMRIRAPSTVLSGQPINLACEYDLMRTPLYSIKWYHDEQEFFRFVPKEDPPGQAFIVDPAIIVDIEKSNAHEVHIPTSQRSLSGTYKCEVTADAPLFHTDIKSANINVFEIIPTNGVPEVYTDHNDVAPGQTVHFTCRTPLFNIQPNITWYIQNEKIHGTSAFDPMVTSIEESFVHKGMYSTRSDLNLNLEFKEEEIQITCSVTLFDIYNKSSSLKLRALSPPPAPIMGPTAPLGQPTNKGLSLHYRKSSTNTGIGHRILLLLISILSIYFHSMVIFVMSR
ncbi:uncharacterized protein LOC123299040 isoform X2 [Chrysoperla carnea]|uniref:uncharacterized protein LOC123299040 isoform X2 n=1 Tax=Chrysoperla carnea TaxID=189513 RepID=UPI001D08900E|nr:uncharacterized protein LOC123299040 isoform X2 [Chrysoperla carnea]